MCKAKKDFVPAVANVAAFKADGAPIASATRITKEPKAAAVRAAKAVAAAAATGRAGAEGKTLKRLHPSGGLAVTAVTAAAVGGGTLRAVKEEQKVAPKLLQAAAISEAAMAPAGIENVVVSASSTLPQSSSVLAASTSAPSVAVSAAPQLLEGARTAVRAADLKAAMKATAVAAAPKPTRPSIIKKTVLKEAVPISAAVSSIMVGIRGAAGEKRPMFQFYGFCVFERNR